MVRTKNWPLNLTRWRALVRRKRGVSMREKGQHPDYSELRCEDMVGIENSLG